MDKAYDAQDLRQGLRRRGIRSCIPLRQYAHRRMLGRPPEAPKRFYRQRWIVERTFGWLSNFRRIVNRWDHSLVAYHGFFTVACIILCVRKLP